MTSKREVRAAGRIVIAVVLAAVSCPVTALGLAAGQMRGGLYGLSAPEREVAGYVALGAFVVFVAACVLGLRTVFRRQG